MKKILVVSESLGEPNHKRGIFHFTRELIRSLAADGHELTLVVETTRRYRKLRRRQRRTPLLPPDSRLIELLALYRFLDETDMNESMTRGIVRRTIDWFKHRISMCTSWEFGQCFLRAIGMLPSRVKLIENKSGGFDRPPPSRAVSALFARAGILQLSGHFRADQATAAANRRA
jgi:hypothetical protein